MNKTIAVSRVFAGLLPGLLLLACLGMPPAAIAQLESPRLPLSAFPRERIAVETRSIRRHLFEAWRAETWQGRMQGLMFVEDREMGPDQAMIFIYEPAQPVTMWMKNTLIPLDMLFVDTRGCVVTIHERAKPGSLASIESRVPVTLVVELKAGTVASTGIRVGDRVVRLDAGWPREAAKCTTAPPA